MDAIGANNKSLSGDGNKTSYKIGDDDENSSNEELHPCLEKKSPSKAKKVIIISKPNSRTTLKSNSKTTVKSSSLNNEKASSSTLEMNFEGHLHKRLYVMFVFAGNSQLSSFVCGIGFFVFYLYVLF